MFKNHLCSSLVITLAIKTDSQMFSYSGGTKFGICGEGNPKQVNWRIMHASVVRSLIISHNERVFRMELYLKCLLFTEKFSWKVKFVRQPDSLSVSSALFMLVMTEKKMKETSLGEHRLSQWSDLILRTFFV